MWFLFDRFKKVIVACILAVIPLALLYAQKKDNEVRDFFARPLIDVAGYIQGKALLFSGGISDALYKYVFLTGSLDEITRLRALASQFKELQIALQEREIQNESLQNLLSAAQLVHEQNPIMGKVVARIGAPLSRMIRVDRGKRDGVFEGAPVVAQNGVVGQVLVAADHFSDILLITDGSSSLDVILQRTRGRGIVRGISDKNRYQIEFRDIDRLKEIREGDVVITSGVNSQFPGGIPLGEIQSILENVEGMYARALIRPYVQFASLEKVLILTAATKEGQVSSTLESQPWPMGAQ